MRTRILATLLLAALATAASAQPTAFTYQGQLKNGGAPASGLHDFQFRLFDAATGGSQLGTVQCADNVTVTQGLFTTTIDFGQQFASQSPRFLEILVRADTGLNCSNTAGFVVLSPRQAITSAPMAAHAKGAFSLDAANGAISNAVIVDNAGKVGIGTLAPTHSVHIANPGPTLALQDTDSTTDQVGYISYRDSANVEQAWVGYGAVGDPDFSIVNARPGGDIVLFPIQGNVGINTGTPTSKLDVRNSGPNVTAVHAEASGNVSAALSGVNTTTLGQSFGVIGDIHSTLGQGVVGDAYSNTGANDGVRGLNLSSDPNAWAVFANARFAAAGTKAFRIDHPADPEHKYLLHYCTESPEVINFYSGKVTLDQRGQAEVPLPPYFASINRDPRYTLTALGSAMPELHIGREVDERLLAAGNAMKPGDAIPACSFIIAGGTPGGRVSWRLEALRSDRWMRQYANPTEVDKPAHENGTYQRPELYGLPFSRSVEFPRLKSMGTLPAAETK